MPRNTEFASPNRPAPFAGHPHIRLVPDTVKGPLPFFNPTRARFHIMREPRHAEPTVEGKPTVEVTVPQTTINWRSRDNRKGEQPCFLVLLIQLVIVGIMRQQ